MSGDHWEQMNYRAEQHRTAPDTSDWEGERGEMMGIQLLYELSDEQFILLDCEYYISKIQVD